MIIWPILLIVTALPAELALAFARRAFSIKILWPLGVIVVFRLVVYSILIIVAPLSIHSILVT
jgi:hypothetical protein